MCLRECSDCLHKDFTGDGAVEAMGLKLVAEEEEGGGVREVHLAALSSKISKNTNLQFHQRQVSLKIIFIVLHLERTIDSRLPVPITLVVPHLERNVLLKQVNVFRVIPAQYMLVIDMH